MVNGPAIRTAITGSFPSSESQDAVTIALILTHSEVVRLRSQHSQALSDYTMSIRSLHERENRLRRTYARWRKRFVTIARPKLVVPGLESPSYLPSGFTRFRKLSNIELVGEHWCFTGPISFSGKLYLTRVLLERKQERLAVLAFGPSRCRSEGQVASVETPLLIKQYISNEALDGRVYSTRQANQILKSTDYVFGTKALRIARYKAILSKHLDSAGVLEKDLGSQVWALANRLTIAESRLLCLLTEVNSRCAASN